MQHEPKRPTQPLQRAKTTHFGDAFVSGQPPAVGATRPLRSPTGPLKEAVSSKLIEVKRELDYVRHLLTLFSPSIGILRFAVHLACMPELPTPDSFDLPPEPEAMTEDAEPDPFATLGTPQKRFALDIAGVLHRDPRVLQRAQVALYQFDEVARAFEEGNAAIDGIAACAYEEAWERLQEIGIERTKGKAYAISGFWDNFKNDPVICKLFPPPTPQNNRGTQPLNLNSAPLGSGNLPKPAPAAPAPPPKATAPEPSGLLGKLKGFFK